MRYLLVDSANLFFRARHSAPKGADTLSKLGLCLHVMFNSINKSQSRVGAEHIVFCLEGHSWRKEVYKPYKKNRQAARAKLTDSELEEDQLFWELYTEFTDYLTSSTNCTVLTHKDAEGDDLIARWIRLHPQDNHVILSNDTDFLQLINEKITMYNAMVNHLITADGYFDDNNQPVIDKKTQKIKEAPIPQWSLFEKCMRGDTSDNIFSAYPGVRTKSTKSRIGLLEAFADKDTKGYAWNNLMLQRWTDHNSQEHRVLTDYTRNCELIDLYKQPAEIKESIDNTIKTTILAKTNVSMVGIKFIRFCAKHELIKLSEYPTSYSEWLNGKYNGILKTSPITEDK